MKIRRALATAAATAVIAPAALMAAPAAYANDGDTTAVTTVESPAPGDPAADTTEDQTDVTTPDTEDTTSSTGENEAEDTTEDGDAPADDQQVAEGEKDAPSDEDKDPADDGREPATEPGGKTEEEEEEELPEFEICEDSKLSVEQSGLPGKIVAGSGWHNFTLTFANPSSSKLSEIDYFAGIGPADESAENAFKANQVVLEVFDEAEGAWMPVEDGSGHSVGWIGWGDLEGEHSSAFKMRVNVKADAPVGAGITIGAGVYFDEDGNCLGDGFQSFQLEIVAPGKGGSTPGTGTKPQTGGKTPVVTPPAKAPSRDNVPEVQGSLAETGSSSMLPAIAVIGGVAMAAGAGAIFVVRRRRAGDLGAAA